MSISEIYELKYNIGFISKININNKEEYLFYYNDKKEKCINFYTQIICNSIIEIPEKLYHSVKYSDFISDKNIQKLNVYASCYINDTCYFIFRTLDNKTLYISLYDINEKIMYPIELQEMDKNLEDIIINLPIRDYTYSLQQNKIYIIGGIVNNKDNSISIQKKIFSFDLENLVFSQEKYHYFSLSPRFRLGSTNDDEGLYVLGGICSIFNKENSNDNYECNNDLENYIKKNNCYVVEYGELGEEDIGKFKKINIKNMDNGGGPEMMIDCFVKEIENRYLVSYSAYKYHKFWVLDKNSNKGKNINLSEQNELIGCNDNKNYYILIDCKALQNDMFNLLIGWIHLKQNKNENKINIKLIYLDNISMK